ATVMHEKFGDGVPQIEDTAPLLPSKYDCTTFVETVAALARSHEPGQFFTNLIAIRYRGGKATYQDRNHFPEADWIPNNIQAEILKAVTAEVAAQASAGTKTETKSIHRDEWLAQQVRAGRVSRSIASTAEAAWKAPVEAKVVYIPYEKLDSVIAK